MKPKADYILESQRYFALSSRVAVTVVSFQALTFGMGAVVRLPEVC